MKSKTFIVTIKVRSETGKRPIVKTLGGDTVFCWLEEGMTGTWKISAKKPRRIKDERYKGNL